MHRRSRHPRVWAFRRDGPLVGSGQDALARGQDSGGSARGASVGVGHRWSVQVRKPRRFSWVGGQESRLLPGARRTCRRRTARRSRSGVQPARDGLGRPGRVQRRQLRVLLAGAGLQHRCLDHPDPLAALRVRPRRFSYSAIFGSGFTVNLGGPLAPQLEQLIRHPNNVGLPILIHLAESTPAASAFRSATLPGTSSRRSSCDGTAQWHPGCATGPSGAADLVQHQSVGVHCGSPPGCCGGRTARPPAPPSRPAPPRPSRAGTAPHERPDRPAGPDRGPVRRHRLRRRARISQCPQGADALRRREREVEAGHPIGPPRSPQPIAGDRVQTAGEQRLQLPLTHQPARGQPKLLQPAAVPTPLAPPPRRRSTQTPGKPPRRRSTATRRCRSSPSSTPPQPPR
jgi:hypothetical protein